jgi:hypothetical protein
MRMISLPSRRPFLFPQFWCCVGSAPTRGTVARDARILNRKVLWLPTFQRHLDEVRAVTPYPPLLAVRIPVSTLIRMFAHRARRDRSASYAVWAGGGRWTCDELPDSHSR